MVDYDGVTRTFNEANQMTNDGTNTLTYDNNGNLTGNGTDTYTWDRANRLLSVGNHSYVYDGLSNRVQQTVSSVVTDYLNDVQPGLTKLLTQTTGANVDRFVHGVRGIHAVDDGTNWNFYAQDVLGSVRAVVDDAGGVQSSMAYDPYGNPMGAYGAGFGFTGEQTDVNGSVFLRARYYEPALGVFSVLDPFEGLQSRPMSLNGYSWVEGNVSNATDPSGMCFLFAGLDTAACLLVWLGVGATTALLSLTAANNANRGGLTTPNMSMPNIQSPNFSDVSSSLYAGALDFCLTGITNIVGLMSQYSVGRGKPADIPLDIPVDEPIVVVPPVAVAPAPNQNPNSTSTPLPQPTLIPLPVNPQVTETVMETPTDEKDVLVLGESDNFAYASTLAARHADWQIVGTKFGSGDNSQRLISRVGNLTLVDNVDGTRLGSGNFTSTHTFSDIVFNAPRAGEGWRGAAGDLVENVLQSGLNVLDVHGHTRFSSGGGMPAVPRLNSLVRQNNIPAGYTTATKIPYLSDTDFGVPYQPTNNNGVPLPITADRLSWYIFSV